MKTLTNVEKVQAEGNLPDDIDYKKLIVYIERASAEMRRTFSEQTYNELLNDLEQDNPAQKTIDLQRAESNLALSFAVVPLGLYAIPTGGYATTAGFKDGSETLLSLSDLKELAAYYSEAYNSIIAPYIPSDEDEGSEDEDAAYAPDHSWHAI